MVLGFIGLARLILFLTRLSVAVVDLNQFAVLRFLQLHQ